MNDKIYTGFKLVPRDLASIATAMESVRVSIEDLQRQRYLQAFARILTYMLDRSQQAVAAGRTEGMDAGVPAWLVRTSIEKRQQRIRTTHARDPDVDLEVILSCWCAPRLGEVVGCAFGEFSDAVLKILKDASVATDYAYWNSGEPDPNIQPDEWAQRRSVWNDVKAQKSGMVFQFRFEGELAALPSQWEEIEPHLPDMDTRARELATPALFRSWYDALPEKRADREDIWQLHARFRRELREQSELQQQLAQAVAIIKASLMSNADLRKSSVSSQPLFAPHDS